MIRPEIDRTLTELERVSRELGRENHAPHCDISKLQTLLQHAAEVRNRLHAQIDEIAFTATQAGIER